MSSPSAHSQEKVRTQIIQETIDSVLNSAITGGVMGRIRGLMSLSLSPDAGPNLAAFKKHIKDELIEQIDEDADFDIAKHLPILARQLRKALAPNYEDPLDNPPLVDLVKGLEHKDKSLKDAKERSLAPIDGIYSSFIRERKKEVSTTVAKTKTAPEGFYDTVTGAYLGAVSYLDFLKKPGFGRVIPTFITGESLHESPTTEEGALDRFNRQLLPGRFVGGALTAYGLYGFAASFFVPPFGVPALMLGALTMGATEVGGRLITNGKAIPGRLGDKLHTLGGDVELIRGHSDKLSTAITGVAITSVGSLNPLTAELSATVGSTIIFAAATAVLRDIPQEIGEHHQRVAHLERIAQENGGKVTEKAIKNTVSDIKKERPDKSLQGKFNNCLLTGAVITILIASAVFAVATFGTGIPALAAVGTMSTTTAVYIGLVSTSCVAALTGKYYDKMLPAINTFKSWVGLKKVEHDIKRNAANEKRTRKLKASLSEEEARTAAEEAAAAAAKAKKEKRTEKGRVSDGIRGGQPNTGVKPKRGVHQRKARRRARRKTGLSKDASRSH